MTKNHGTGEKDGGAAWVGGSEVTKVEVSEDGGLTWAAARLLDVPPNAPATSAAPVADAWRLWE